MPDYSDFPDLFIKNLEKEGFIGYLITDKIPKFKYKGAEKIKNFFIKNFLRNKDYKRKLVAIHQSEELLKKIQTIQEKMDYTLVIRPDVFPIPFIEKLKNKTEKLIAYQWDGINKFPEIKNYYHLFDCFFCFDKDSSQTNLKQITNFYFDIYPPQHKPYNMQKPKLYYVGLYWKNREQKINNFIDYISKIDLNIDLDFNLQLLHEISDKKKEIKYLKERISFQDNLKKVIDSDVLLDFVDPLHHGLSIRFFESLYYQKKIITDNLTVKDYDFYNENNIFVLSKNNENEIKNFLLKPYEVIPENIVKKYSFSSWIKEIIKN